jgi:hypothetical protein
MDVGRHPQRLSCRNERLLELAQGRMSAYRATTAQWHADRAARRPKPAKLAVNAKLRRYVQSGWPAWSSR